MKEIDFEERIQRAMSVFLETVNREKIIEVEGWYENPLLTPLYEMMEAVAGDQFDKGLRSFSEDDAIDKLDEIQDVVEDFVDWMNSHYTLKPEI